MCMNTQLHTIIGACVQAKSRCNAKDASVTHVAGVHSMGQARGLNVSGTVAR